MTTAPTKGGLCMRFSGPNQQILGKWLDLYGWHYTSENDHFEPKNKSLFQMNFSSKRWCSCSMLIFGPTPTPVHSPIVKVKFCLGSRIIRIYKNHIIIWLWGGPLPVISGVITPISRVIKPFIHLFLAIYRGYFTLLTSSRGPPCTTSCEPESWQHPKCVSDIGSMYIPGTYLSSIFGLQPSKTRPFPIKTRVIWVPGTSTFTI